MKRRSETPTEAVAEEKAEGTIVSLPILPTQVQAGAMQTEDGGVVMLNLSTILSRDNLYALDRSQAMTLGAELMKLARGLPSEKEQARAAKRIEVPRPEGETELPSGLVLP